MIFSVIPISQKKVAIAEEKIPISQKKVAIQAENGLSLRTRTTD